MLPKAKSVTTSSKSATNKSSGGETPIQYVKGVGPRLGAVFKNRGIETVKDILTFFPRAYEDRTQLLGISELREGEKSTVSVSVTGVRKIPTRKFGRSILEVRCTDQSGAVLSLKWFHAPRGMESRFTPGAQLIATGLVKTFMGKPEMIHPEITWGVSAAASEAEAHYNIGRIVPIYTEIEGIPSRSLRKILWEAIEKFSCTLNEDLPEQYLKTYGLPPLGASIRAIHFPSEDNTADLVKFNTPAHWRLIYEEFFKFEYLILRQRLRMEKAHATPIALDSGREAVASLEKMLPFKLTGDQHKAISEILTDLSQPHPMNRLIQGDVGSGKTAVAFLAAASVLAQGSQAALMAPTEILAEQHFKNAGRIFGERLNVALLTGKTSAQERTAIQSRLSAGEPVLVIGTHALIEDPVEFKKLIFIMIDEQHRFGVEQRRTLRNKGTYIDSEAGRKVLPHTLILTATPIPRTLALTAYGDLSVTNIREMPPGRTPVITQVVDERAEKDRAYEQIRNELKKGRQAYFIYPLVNDSEAEGFTQLKSVVTESERLAREVFPEFKVGLLHGQQKSDDKASVMDRFQKNEIQVLVSTTVIEVGIDVPNATIIVIEHSERFGLSQLHQLRGRVGRGSLQSYCFLFSARHTGETATQRLDVLEQTSDGFKIAEADLEIRGPGEFLGVRQAGTLPFRLGNIVRDREWLLRARDDASALLREDPELVRPDHQRLRQYYEREGKIQFDRLNTS